ncbi:hypothetical protein CANARDRAFT_204426 [[Candida] arabinofermentans NRRL YB-2248]|uniref:Uncharacterized protein n=1 Tax=[Candida] arabinofermentans NRRL YB-2248 TaxID=983967 RepID=A0A1E4STJ8_9ASCO|nr:hypothetical protein CANARDRAFT_204426 [[Candida] arabinofermentans NRRL YB-2248]
MQQEKLMASRVYTFDLGDDFKPLDETVDEKDFYSGKYLSKRYISKEVLEKAFQGMKLMRVEHVFAKITPPEFQAPQYSNYVVFGIIVTKSETKNTSDNRSKFLKIQLSNFKQQVTVTILGTAFDKYWKLRVGDVVAILNPSVYVYQTEKGKGFTLSLKNSEGFILEIGRSKHFGKCKSIKKDGSVCDTPVDTSKTEYCDYHVEMHVNKTASKRLELSGSFRMFSPTEDGTKQAMYMNKKGSVSGGGGGQLVTDDFAPKYDRKAEMGRLYFSNPDASRAFFDKDYSNPNIMQERKIRKEKTDRIAKERKLREKLINLTNSTVLKNNEYVESQELKETKQKITNVAFGAKIMNKIGFDPTRRMFEKPNNDEGTIKSIALINELKKESLKKEMNLKASVEETLEKKRKWATNEKNLKLYRQGDSITKKSKPKLKPKPKMVELSSSDDDDSE